MEATFIVRCSGTFPPLKLKSLIHVIFFLQMCTSQFVSQSIFTQQERMNKFYQGVFEHEKGITFIMVCLLSTLVAVLTVQSTDNIYPHRH